MWSSQEAFVPEHLIMRSLIYETDQTSLLNKLKLNSQLKEENAITSGPSCNCLP